MPKTTHAELVFHTLRYVTETLAEGDSMPSWIWAFGWIRSRASNA